MNTVVKQRYLTKTRFKLAVECPTKLFYSGKPDIYADTKQEDDFLKALAEGGFQVGELAKLMYPGGHDIKSLNHEEALNETRQLLSQGDVTIYEAAVQHGNLFVRVDILRKTGNRLDLIEVKAKSFDSTHADTFRQRKGGIKKEMLPYLQDVAFQRHVLALAYPDWVVDCFLMLADKSKTCTVDGLNQKFKISRGGGGRTSVQVAPGTRLQDLGASVLSCVDVSDLVNDILQNPVAAVGQAATLAELAQSWGESYRADSKIPPTVGAHCAKCEFTTTSSASNLKSGFHECWREALGWSDEKINRGTVLDIWNFKRKQELMDMGIVEIGAVTQDHLNYSKGEEGLSRSQRQWMQVSKVWPGGGEFYFDRQFMAAEMATWKFPLHFIDFETARVAIPFFSGQRPYDNIAFQFSHHEVQADGSVAHKTQFLGTRPGVRPNYEFVRQLKTAVGSIGTVFMWFPHENTTLNAILDELDEDASPPSDADEIRSTILELTIVKDKNKTVRAGGRAMVDLCKLAEKAFFHPSTNASSSIKKVLPAVMQCSAFLKTKYSKPVYGALGGIPSLNFRDHVWWRQSASGAENPYKLLPPVFSDVPEAMLDQLESGEEMEIAEGGAATTAYARLQFENLSAQERKYIEDALLRYCELDTLAMVMIYEAWVGWL
jgi:hypothetical protein